MATSRLSPSCMRAAAAAALLTAASPAFADPIRDFYAGKTMNMIVSTGAGSIFDNTARAISRHMAQYLPGSPAFVVRNMPGAGHMRATQFMYAQAPKDGTHMAVVNNGIPLEQLVAGSSDSQNSFRPWRRVHSLLRRTIRLDLQARIDAAAQT